MEIYPLVIVLAFVVLDILTGIVKAFATTGFDSSIMRQGFFHKLGELLSIALCMVVDYTMPRFGISDLPNLANMCCLYLCVMEVGSIIENLGKINPELTGPLNQIFAKLKGENNDTN